MEKTFMVPQLSRKNLQGGGGGGGENTPARKNRVYIQHDTP